MRAIRFLCVAVVSTTAALVAVAAAGPAAATPLPNYDAFDAASSGHASLNLGQNTPRVVRPGWVHVEPRMAVPTFLWLNGATGMFWPGRSPTSLSAARVVLGRLASLYRMVPADLRTVQVHSIHDTGFGAIIVKFRQEVDGIPVFRDEIKVMLDRNLRPVAVAGYLPTHAALTSRGRYLPFALTEEEAVATAFGDVAGASANPADFVATGLIRGKYRYVAHVGRPSSFSLASPARARPVFFNLADRLEPAWHVEVMVTDHLGGDTVSGYGYVVSAVNGTILFRKNLTDRDSFTYRVWAGDATPFTPYDGPQGYVGTPHPTGVPDGYVAPAVAMELLTLEHAGISTGDPWLPASATTTQGNNVDAYADLYGPDGYSSGDVRPDLTAANTFDRIFDLQQQPRASTDQIMASATNIFYTINFLHDWFYDVGFDEVSGNAQEDNYGRGGLDSDRLLAEAQDFDGVNNANMQTPADGSHPRMQMFLFETVSGIRSFTVNSPPAIAGQYNSAPAAFGPQVFDVTADMVLVDDGSGTASDGCQSPFVNAGQVSGSIALIDRGTCTFVQKVNNAQSAGALGVIIANNQSGLLNEMGGSDPNITIGSLMITQADGNAIKGQLPGVNATMTRTGGTYIDGTLDNSVVAHEWGHYISNRLVGNASGLGTEMAQALGEGWADFHALLMMARAEDASHSANVNWTGTFAVGGYVSGATEANGQYFGFRRFPYSVDFAKNALTFRHISDGEALPSGPPQNPNSSDNSEVHNAGEIWGTMLWECYVALLTDTGRLTFGEAQDRMRAYLVAAYKMTPNAPTYTEARDALLASMFAADVDDGMLCAQAFARRGAGFGAISPDRYSDTFAGVTESYEVGNDLAFVSAALDDSVVWCDLDGNLDVGETGLVTVTLKNAGHGELTNTTAVVSSTHPGLSFSNGGQITFQSTSPFQEATGTVEVTLNDATDMEVLDIDIDYTDSGLTVPGTRSASLTVRVHYDSGIPASFDDVESEMTTWTPDGDGSMGPAIPWARVAHSQADHRWAIPDNGTPSDQYLVSPPLEVASTGNFTFSFFHRHRFEFSDDTWWDGGVIELSTDDGTTWQDIGASATPGYNCTLYDRADNPNPLRGRPAYGSSSDFYPAMGRVDVDLGTAYQGQTVRIRFRVGTDWAAGDEGWELDDFDFPNITNQPFFTIGPDTGNCVDRRPIADAGPDQTVDEGTQVTLDGSGSTDPDGQGLTYNWAQATGPAVTLSDVTAVSPTFTAPMVDQDTDLAFLLTVSDGTYTSVPDAVTITIRNAGAQQDGGTDGDGGDATNLPGPGRGCSCRQAGASGEPVPIPLFFLVLMGLVLAANLKRKR